MKLYYAPLACSLADHIALREAALTFDLERVDIHACRTEHGLDYRTINPKGYVPALVLDDGQMITENVAVLDWIAGQSPSLAHDGPLGRTRVLEALTYITSEIHRAFKPMWHAGTVAEKAAAASIVTKLLRPLGEQLAQDSYLFGDRPSVADFYLFVMLLWAERFDVEVPAPLIGLRDRIRARPAVQSAMAYEGLI